jgi:hypothetical protein
VEEQKLGIQEQKLERGRRLRRDAQRFCGPGRRGQARSGAAFVALAVITLTIIYVVFGYLMLPYTLAVVDLRISQQISSKTYPSSRPSGPRTVTHISTNSSQLRSGDRHPAPAAVCLAGERNGVHGGIARQIPRHFLAHGGLRADSSAAVPLRPTS